MAVHLALVIFFVSIKKSKGDFLKGSCLEEADFVRLLSLHWVSCFSFIARLAYNKASMLAFSYQHNLKKKKKKKKTKNKKKKTKPPA